MLLIRPHRNRGVLHGELPEKIEQELQDHFVWYDVNDLTNPIYFYADKVMYLGMMYEVSNYLNARGFPCEVSLPGLPPKEFDWKFEGTYRPRQEDAVQTMVRDRFGVLKAAPGFGKTVCMAAITATISRKTAIIVQAGEPFDQAYNTLRKLTNIPKIGRVSGEVRDIQPATVYMIQSLAKEIAENGDGEVAKAFAEAEVVMVDECFPAGTLIDGIPIEQLKVGCMVESFNHETGCIELKRVRFLYKSNPREMVRVWFDDNSFQDCTYGHPFWTGERYEAAALLESGAVVYTKHHANAMYLVQENIRTDREESERPYTKRPERLLFVRMWERISQATKPRNYGGNQPQIRLGKDEAEQPNAPWRQLGAYERNIAEDWTQTKSEGRQWARVDRLRTATARLFRWLGRQLRFQNTHEARQLLSQSLQDRHCSSSNEDCCRGGRVVSQRTGTSGTGSKEGSILAGKRVDRVEIHEQTSDGTFGGVCPDSYVYNIEVEGNHNYFANGVLVHNCHHAAADTYLMALGHVENPSYVLGFSATPEDREDGLQPFVNAYLGRPRYEVTYGEQIDLGSLCPVTVYVTNIPERNYGYSMDREIPAYRKRKLYQEVYDSYIVNNLHRNQEGLLFTQDMIDQGHSVAIIVSRVPHAYEIHKLYPQAVVLTGETNKHDRRDILSKLRQKEIMCVVTTLFDEATDVPSLGAVCMLAGGKTEIRLRQRIRSTRTFSGETARGHYTKTRGYVWYPIDQADFLRSHSAKCLKTLRSIVKEHPLNELLWVQ